MIGVSALNFGKNENNAFIDTTANICGVSTSSILITSVTDSTSASSAHLVTEVQAVESVDVAFQVLTELPAGSVESDVAAKNRAITTALTVSLSASGSASFVSILQSFAQQNLATNLYAASVSNAGFVSRGFRVSAVTALPSTQPIGNGKGGVKQKKAKLTKAPKVGIVSKGKVKMPIVSDQKKKKDPKPVNHPMRAKPPKNSKVSVDHKKKGPKAE